MASFPLIACVFASVTINVHARPFVTFGRSGALHNLQDHVHCVYKV